MGSLADGCSVVEAVERELTVARNEWGDEAVSELLSYLLTDQHVNTTCRQRAARHVVTA